MGGKCETVRGSAMQEVDDGQPPVEDVLVSPAAVAGGHCQGRLFKCAPAAFELLLDCLMDRDVEPLKAHGDPALQDAFAKLAWLQEWCRMHRVSVLELQPDQGSGAVELQLQDLIETPKACFVCESERFFVACARCCVACWCSEKCVRSGYAEHQPLCIRGSQ